MVAGAVAAVREVEVHALPLDRLGALLDADRAELFDRTAERARSVLAGRRVVNVNSTATGGGVAELLQMLLAYGRGAGVDTRWVTVEGDARFFEITKRIHNHLYGTKGDGGSLGSRERDHYDEIMRRNAARMGDVLRPGDIAVLHDPQTAGLVGPLAARGARVVWRCHVGIDTPNEHSEYGWAFLRPDVAGAEAWVFSRRQFAPEWLPAERVAVIPPSIDPFSAKNELIEPAQVAQILRRVGMLAGKATGPAVSFPRRDGSRGRVTRPVDLLGTGPPPPTSVPLVLQASRWDAMKDMRGVMTAFAESVAPGTDAHLVLTGPEAHGVADDPEAGVVLRDCLEAWKQLPHPIRRRVHLVSVPMADADEAAAIVNAMQRHAALVTQKSLAEGFGLTVTEAMWKARPVVGSAVGGIVDQIVHGRTGMLVEPHDLDAFASVLCSLLADHETAEELGTAARERVRDQFLGDRHLEQWAALLERLT